MLQPTDLEILHLVVALEALVSDHTAGARVTTRFVQRLLALLPADRRDAPALEALYNMRSEMATKGSALTPGHALPRRPHPVADPSPDLIVTRLHPARRANACT